MWNSDGSDAPANRPRGRAGNAVFWNSDGSPTENPPMPGPSRPASLVRRPGEMPDGADPFDPRMSARRRMEAARGREAMANCTEQQRTNFVRTVEEVAARNPNIRPEVFKAIVDEYMADQPAREAEMLRAYKENTTPSAVKADLARVSQKYGEKLRDSIYLKYGDEGMAAMTEVTKAMRPKSIFSSIFGRIGDMFFNSDNGGPQWGGLIGGILGALFGFKTGGIVGALLGGGGMALLGHRLADGTPPPLQTPNFRGSHFDRPRAPGRGRGVEFTDRTIGTKAVNPEVSVEADPDPSRTTPDAQGVIVTVKDAANPSYIRTYAGTYNAATRDLTIDGTRMNSPDGWTSIADTVSGNVVIPNVDITVDAGAVKAFTLTQDQLEPARLRAEARARPTDVMAEVTPTSRNAEFDRLLGETPALVRGDADARTMGIRGVTKPTTPQLG